MIMINIAEVQNADLNQLAAAYAAVRNPEIAQGDVSSNIANLTAVSLADQAVRQVVAAKGNLTDEDAAARWFRSYLLARLAYGAAAA